MKMKSVCSRLIYAMRSLFPPSFIIYQARLLVEIIRQNGSVGAVFIYNLNRKQVLVPSPCGTFLGLVLLSFWVKRRSGQLSCFKFLTKRSRKASFRVIYVAVTESCWQLFGKFLVISFGRIFWLVYSFWVIQKPRFSFLFLLTDC